MMNDTANTLDDWSMDDQGYVHGGFDPETPLFMEAKAERNARLDAEIEAEIDRIQEELNKAREIEHEQALEIFQQKLLTPEISVPPKKPTLGEKTKHFFGEMWLTLKDIFTFRAVQE